MRAIVFLLAASAPAAAQQNWPYATYLGGAGDDAIRMVASDDDGSTLLAGVSGAQTFLMKLDARQRPVFSKVLGSGQATALAVDAAGNAFVAGTIEVTADFATPGAFQPQAAVFQAFVAKYSPSGDKLFATYFGSRSAVQIRALAVDSGGSPIICGSGAGDAVPLTDSSLFRPAGSRPSAFCAQLSADGSRLLASTLLGNPGGAISPLAAALDADGNLTVAGWTGAEDFPLVNAFQSEDRRRTVFRSDSEGTFHGSGGASLGSVVSLQVIGAEVFAGTRDSGIWASTDGGDTWDRLPGTWSGAVSAHPLNTRLLCVASGGGALCSTDRGNNWQPVASSGITGVVADPRQQAFFFTTDRATRPVVFPIQGVPAATQPFNLSAPLASVSFDSTGNRILAVTNAPNSLYLSEDRGATFRKLADNVARASAAPSDPSRIYAVRSARVSAGDSLVIRSDDGGRTWSDTLEAAPFTRVEQVAVDPGNADVVFTVTGIGAYRSGDGGRSWQLWTPPGLGNAAVSTITFDGQQRLWAGSFDFGNAFLMKLNLSEPAILWSTLVGGVGGGQFNGMRLDPEGRILVTGSSLGFDLAATSDDSGAREQIPAGFAAEFDGSGRLEVLRYLGVLPVGIDGAPDGSWHVAANTAAGHAAWLSITPDLSGFAMMTPFGGDGRDQAMAIHVGRDGRVRIVGSTTSENLPVSPDALQERPGGGTDGFLAIASLP